MLRYPNTTTWSDRTRTAVDTFVGGDVVAIVLRQSMRLKAFADGAAFRARQQQLTTIRGNVFNPTAFVADIPVTVIQQEAYELSADATQYPVESGAIISDHIILRPIKITISFEVSNWEGGKPSYAMDLIEALWARRIPVELMTNFRKIPNMVLTNFSGSNSVPQWGVLSGRATFQQIGLGVLQTVQWTREKVTPTEKTGGPDTTQSALPAENSTITQPKTSILEKGRQAIFGKK